MAKKSKGGKKNILQHLTTTQSSKGNIKNTLIETGKDLLFCIVGGGLLGAAVGRPSLLIGLGVTGTGNYMGSRQLTLLGLGMMAANGFQSKSTNGVDGLDLNSIKERVITYKDNFADKLYLDKLTGKKSDSQAANGFGELQFFSYPNDVASQGGDLNGDLAALDRIEAQIDQSAMNQLQIAGADDLNGALAELGEEINGMEGNEIIDISGLNL